MVRPGVEAHGKEAIKAAFVKIAAYFQNSMCLLKGRWSCWRGRYGLVLSQTLLDADNKETSEYSMDRRATYVFRLVDGQWKCAIDNSYGTTLLDEGNRHGTLLLGILLFLGVFLHPCDPEWRDHAPFWLYL